MVPRAMTMRMLVLAGWLLLLIAVAPAPGAQEDARRSLDAIHDDLVQLRFEKALAGIEALLGEPTLDEADRAEALILRSQTHVAFGDMAAAEQDYREILALRPAYEPDESLTPKKARERFDRARAETVGRLLPSVDPPAARLVVDGREVGGDPAGGLWLVAGSHRVRAESAGFDALERDVTIEAGKDNTLELRLVPNARSVVLRTDIADVEVRVDGVLVGVTERRREADGSWTAPEAELSVENLPLGEHVFELSKPCFRTERRRDQLAVDLLDREPKRYDLVRMKPARGRLVLRGGPAGAGVLLDGEPAGSLPLEAQEVCPGTREVVLSYGGRRIWVSRESVAEADERVVEVAPRPNVVLLGAERWPAGYEGFARLSRVESPAALPPRVDFSDERTWERLGLARDADLALAVVPSSRPGARDEVWLHSPILGIVAPLGAAPELAAPGWSRPSWGLYVVDSRVGGRARVVDVTPRGPAAAAGIAPGDRVLAVGGIDVEESAALRRVLSVASAAAPLSLRWQRPDGTTREAELRATITPELRAVAGEPPQAMLRAAWATVDGVSHPPAEAAPALANLALLLAAFERDERAAEVWKRTRFGERAGVGPGTADYYVGVALLEQGREREATAALRAAAASEATAFDDEGPRVAPAARDRLADLGVAARAD